MNPDPIVVDCGDRYEVCTDGRVRASFAYGPSGVSRRRVFAVAESYRRRCGGSGKDNR